MFFKKRALDELPIAKDFERREEKAPHIMRISRLSLEYLAKELRIPFDKNVSKETLYTAIFGGDKNDAY